MKMIHKVGNQYKFSGHILELVEVTYDSLFKTKRYKLNCQVHGGCCDIPNGLKIECTVDYFDNMEPIRIVAKHPHQWQSGDIAKVKSGWARAGTEFQVLGPAVFAVYLWVPILDPDDDEEQPTYHKEAALERLVNVNLR